MQRLCAAHVRARVLAVQIEIFMPSRDRPLTYLPMRSDDARWVSYGGNGVTSWERGTGDPQGKVELFHGSAVLPPPPRPPKLAALLSHANDLGLSSSVYAKEPSKREVQHVSCWRLRWCALCLVRALLHPTALPNVMLTAPRCPACRWQVIAVALQASTVGSRVQSFFGGDAGERAPGAGADLIGAALLLAVLLIALWSLLSQLLLWSDSAVMKLPSGVRVSDAKDGADE